MLHLPNLKVLHLSYNFNLIGSLPEFPPGTPLQQLFLAYTNYTGHIPDSIGNLKQLTDLEVGHSGFFGPLPHSLGNLEQLSKFTVGNCGFSGPLPDSFGNLGKLAVLDLSGNNFEGEIPLSFSKLSRLEKLDMSFNGFVGPLPSLKSSCMTIARIHLSFNEFSGPIPSSYANNSLPNLTHLVLSKNQLNGTIPPSLFTLPSLQEMYLDRNKFIGILDDEAFPNSISSPLKRLDLSYNLFEGNIPKFISKFTSLEYLFLISNNFHGTVDLRMFASIKNLSTIDLSDNIMLLIDTSDLAIAIPSLSEFGASSCNLSVGLIPDTFGSECSLEGLNLNGNQLEGPLPRSLVNCRGLSVLDLGNNQIDDTFPFWLEHLESLQVLMLQSNKFHGPVRRHHVANSSFESLHIISLSTNSFTGHLPLEYFSSSYLEGLYENDDHQTSHSAMPDVTYTFLMFPNKGQALEYSSVQISELNAIDLSSNLFDGEIPTSIGDYKSLMSLNLSHNSLVGKIPSSLANLTQLESLDLSNNDLVGEIPSELTSLTFLSVLKVSRNHLIGMIPSGRQFDTFPSSSFEGNSRLCGIQLKIDCNPNKSGNVAPPSDNANQSNGTNFDWIFASGEDMDQGL
ncbi:hypothetical protein Syun_002967 [Stephania yunnanensis]|uniref:Chaoptin n=1 Tax=Stephania yunnanensis TaxID=152371 RepID=A0AAP0L1C3_9MAGN